MQHDSDDYRETQDDHQGERHAREVQLVGSDERVRHLDRVRPGDGLGSAPIEGECCQGDEERGQPPVCDERAVQCPQEPTDANGRVYVSDRGNQRLQVFDSNGKFLDQWPGISPWALYMSNDQHLWIADGSTDRFLEFDLSGKFLYGWGTHGTGPGQFWAVHGFSVDTDGNMYAAETYGGRTQKFRPRAGADRSKLMGAPVPLMPKSGS